MKVIKVMPDIQHDTLSIVRKSYVGAFGSEIAAVLVNMYAYWHGVKIASLSEENARPNRRVDKSNVGLMQFHSQVSLIEQVQIGAKNSIISANKHLVEIGVISVHRNPNNKIDNTNYFLFHPEIAAKIVSEYLISIGEEWRLPTRENTQNLDKLGIFPLSENKQSETVDANLPLSENKQWAVPKQTNNINKINKEDYSQIENLEKSKIFSKKNFADASLVSPSASLEKTTEPRFKLKGKTLFEISEDLLEFYTQHGNYWKELSGELTSHGYNVEKGTEQQQIKKFRDFFKSWANFWYNKSKAPKYPTYVELHNMIYGDIGKMIKSKALEVAAAPAASKSSDSIAAAISSGAIVIPKRR